MIIPTAMKKLVVCLSLACFTNLLAAQVKLNSFLEDNAAVPREHALDVKKLKLELSFDAVHGLVKGKVTHYFSALRPAVSSFFMDGINMHIQSAVLDGQPVPYTLDSTGITINPIKPLHWNTEDSLTITYEVSPRRGLYFVGWNDPANASRKQIWSQGEGIDNRCWIPMYDERNDKILSELIVTFDADYKVLSNGSLIDKHTNIDGTLTWHYAMQHPHAPYLIMLGIGKYDIKETHSASGVPMHLYYYPEWKNRVEPTYWHSEDMVNFYEKEIGVPYPWESYSQIPVQDYMFGAMENTTATIYGDFYQVDSRGILDRNYIAVNAHELAHQWFGDMVTARSDAHQWLQESFATYYNMMYEREVFGEDYFNWSRRGSQNASVSESLKNKFGVGHSEGGGTRLYGKGAFVLNMLKYVLGSRELYNKAIKAYLEKHAYQNVDSHDLLISFEETTGLQLDWFWDEWIYRGGEPDYTVDLSIAGTNAQLVIRQTQALTDYVGYKNGLYKMPVWIQVFYTDGTSAKKQYWIQQQTEIINLPSENNKTIDFVLFDPNNEILKSVTFKKTVSALRAQAIKAPAMLDRYDAVVGLKNVAVDQKRDVLIKEYYTELFYPIRTEVIAQLANDQDPKSIVLFRDALADHDPFVRKAALKFLDPLSNNLLPAFEKLLTDSSYEIGENALQKLVFVNPSKTENYLLQTKNVEGNLGKNVLVRWLETAYHASGKKEYAAKLVELTSPSFEFRTRANAMYALKRLNYFSEDLLANAVDAVLNPNGRLSGPATDLLNFFLQQDAYKTRINHYIAGRNWTGWQRIKLSESGF